jgi:hypothetical protein
MTAHPAGSNHGSSRAILQIHVERIPDWDTGLNTETTVDCARKLMHRFREEDVLKLIDDVENEVADEEEEDHDNA